MLLNGYHALLCCRDKTVYILNPGVGDKLLLSTTDTVLSALPEESSGGSSYLNATILLIRLFALFCWRDLSIALCCGAQIKCIMWH